VTIGALIGAILRTMNPPVQESLTHFTSHCK